VRKDISNYLQQEEFENASLDIIIVDEQTRSSIRDLKNCDKIKNLADVVSISKVKLDGSYFEVYR